MASPREDDSRSTGWSTGAFLELRKRAIKKAASGLGGAQDQTPDAVLSLLEELRIHQIELEMQNEELRHTRADMENSRARYFDLYDLAPVGYVTVDDQDAIVEMNLRAAALFAATRTAFAGRSFSSSIAAEDQDIHYLTRRRLLDTGIPQVCELRMLRLDGPAFWARVEMSIGHEHSTRVCRVVIVDITDRKMAEIRLQESERQVRQQADAMPQIVWTTAASGAVEDCNERWYEYTGFTFEQTKGRGWQSVVHPEDLRGCIDAATRGLANETAFEFECRLKRAVDGSYRWHLARAVPYCDQQGSILRWFGAGTDIHEQKMAQERLASEVLIRTSAFQRLQVTEEELRRSVAEKDILLQELHHRVKNNLQLMSSLLRMQSEVLKDQRGSEALKESHQRILSMALIHERLNGDRHANRIDFGEYTQALINELSYSYAGSAGHVASNLPTASVFLSVDQAIPCGLILNELVTNALKYAYPPGRHGEVLVEVTETHAGFVHITVSDKGVGLPDDFDWKKTKSMGLPIVEILTQQIGGKLTVRSKPGASFTVEFLREDTSMVQAAAI